MRDKNMFEIRIIKRLSLCLYGQKNYSVLFLLFTTYGSFILHPYKSLKIRSDIEIKRRFCKL